MLAGTSRYKHCGELESLERASVDKTELNCFASVFWPHHLCYACHLLLWTIYLKGCHGRARQKAAALSLPLLLHVSGVRPVTQGTSSIMSLLKLPAPRRSLERVLASLVMHWKIGGSTLSLPWCVWLLSAHAEGAAQLRSRWSRTAHPSFCSVGRSNRRRFQQLPVCGWKKWEISSLQQIREAKTWFWQCSCLLSPEVYGNEVVPVYARRFVLVLWIVDIRTSQYRYCWEQALYKLVMCLADLSLARNSYEN